MFDAAVRERSDALVRTLLDSVRIASVSLTGEGISDEVAFLRGRREGWGFAVEVHETTSHPILYAEANLCCYSDGPMFPNDQPVLLMGVRGNLGIEFVARGAKRNLHSGNFGGVAPNPTLDLIHLLSEIVDREGRLLVPGAAYAEVNV